MREAAVITLFDFEATALSSGLGKLADVTGKVALVVNVASQCGNTPQYEGLEALYRKYRDRGFVVLGFPCSQFAGQEFSDAEAIGDFCQANYGVTFPMFAKINVNGRHAHPLYKWMKKERHGRLTGVIPWNFTKFLLDKSGNVIARYSPDDLPASLVPDIRAALAAAK